MTASVPPRPREASSPSPDSLHLLGVPAHQEPVQVTSDPGKCGVERESRLVGGVGETRRAGEMVGEAVHRMSARQHGRQLRVGRLLGEEPRGGQLGESGAGVRLGARRVAVPDRPACGGVGRRRPGLEGLLGSPRSAAWPGAAVRAEVVEGAHRSAEQGTGT